MNKIFISGSSDDQEWKDELLKHLSVLEKEGELEVWHDGKISAGDDRTSIIQRAISTSQIAVLLISPDFLASERIQEAQIPIIQQQKQARGKEFTVIPLLIRPSAWKQLTWLSALQAWPLNEEAIPAGERDYYFSGFVNHLKSLLASEPEKEKQTTITPESKAGSIETVSVPNTSTKQTGSNNKWLETIFRRYWWVLLLLVLGAILGWVFLPDAKNDRKPQQVLEEMGITIILLENNKKNPEFAPPDYFWRHKEVMALDTFLFPFEVFIDSFFVEDSTEMNSQLRLVEKDSFWVLELGITQEQIDAYAGIMFSFSEEYYLSAKDRIGDYNKSAWEMLPKNSKSNKEFIYMDRLSRRLPQFRIKKE
ncbi:MAG: toll/interleukin-1 receptor domain-containing protein [Flavobacteriaceae bacterium]|nr:toll/interleukin-1 receptor domain-containing protein [Flavobacteriaceae bacterium]